jgi:hypothetical protein
MNEQWQLASNNLGRDTQRASTLEGFISKAESDFAVEAESDFTKKHYEQLKSAIESAQYTVNILLRYGGALNRETGEVLLTREEIETVFPVFSAQQQGYLIETPIDIGKRKGAWKKLSNLLIKKTLESDDYAVREVSLIFPNLIDRFIINNKGELKFNKTNMPTTDAKSLIKSNIITDLSKIVINTFQAYGIEIIDGKKDLSIMLTELIIKAELQKNREP